MSEEMTRYYDKRAPVYDRVYFYPERQAELRVLEKMVAAHFVGLEVLEIAAGTGYWTQFIAQRAERVLATDINRSTLDELQQRHANDGVNVAVADAFELAGIEREFDAAFAGCWFSHIAIAARQKWLAKLHEKLHVGARVLILDNSFAQTERIPIIDTDSDGNTYQERATDDGATYRVIKNFPTQEEMQALVPGKFQLFTHYWTYAYTLA